MTLSPHNGKRCNGPKRSPLSTSFIARIALMAALALIISYVEAVIPYAPTVPGIKLGLANIVTVVALYRFGVRDAISVSAVRIILSGLLFNGLFGMLYSMAGALLSLVGMAVLKRTRLFSIVGVSMAAGVLHNMGQLVVAAVLIEDFRIFFYFPVLMFSGIAAGILVGIAATVIIKSVKDPL